MGKGSHNKGILYRSKGRAGLKRGYKSHLRVVVKEVSSEEIKSTPYYWRWEQAAKILEVPWEERVAKLPRYKRPEGYVPGERRLPILPITPAD